MDKATENTTTINDSSTPGAADGSKVHLDQEVLEQLNTDEAISLHSLIDDLTACGVGKIVDLPQIIVVGEQSSGKSSVLQAITRVRFPVASGVCTRFATEIVLRKASRPHVQVKIRFSDERDEREEHIERQAFSERDLPGIIEEAKQRMGLAAVNDRDFSKHVLHVEIQGPDMSPLTLVDLPGIFHVDDEKQSDQGRKTVDELVNGYMKQTNSIILAVVEANAQIVKHHVLKRSKEDEYDPKRQRTLGVITKPDQASQEEVTAYIRLANNQNPNHNLKMGWHVLRNHGPDDESDADDLDARDKLEAAFFNEKSLWNSIKETNRGIGHLRSKLSGVLYNHTRRSVPGVIEDIEKKLAERLQELKQYGEERSSIKDMRLFLVNLSTDFVRLTCDAINGHYTDDFFGDLSLPANRLRAELRSFHRAFDYAMENFGHEYTIEWHPGNRLREPNPYSHLTDSMAKLLRQPPYLMSLPPFRSRHDINAMLEKRAIETQGKELPGSCNSELAIQLFRDLSKPWEEITKRHIDNVVSACRAFVTILFQDLIGGQDTSPALDKIREYHIYPFFEKKRDELETKVQELLEPYVKGYALPLDSEFYRLIQRGTALRLVRTLQSLPLPQIEPLGENDAVERITQEQLSKAIKIDHASDGGAFETERILDMAEAYYEMARRTFTENIMNLAIERCLVKHLADILTPSKVLQMDDDELKHIAAEPEANQQRRTQLQREIATLKKGLSKCNSWKPLPTHTGLAADFSRDKNLANSMSASTDHDKGTPELKGSKAVSSNNRLFASMPSNAPAATGINVQTWKAAVPGRSSKPQDHSSSSDDKRNPFISSVFGAGSIGSSSNSSATTHTPLFGSVASDSSKSGTDRFSGSPPNLFGDPGIFASSGIKSRFSPQNPTNSQSSKPIKSPQSPGKGGSGGFNFNTNL